MGNALHKTKYTSPTSYQTQKEFLHVFARSIWSLIHHEIGDARIYLNIDKARDELKRKQMTHVIGFVYRSEFT